VRKKHTVFLRDENVPSPYFPNSAKTPALFPNNSMPQGKARFLLKC
jgi:hypothetical protein